MPCILLPASLFAVGISQSAQEANTTSESNRSEVMSIKAFGYFIMLNNPIQNTTRSLSER